MHLLIKAINSCVLTHFPKRAPIGLEDYKSLVRRHNLWASSCMIAFERNSKDVISALIGCKRDRETLIYLFGTRPDAMRQGHMKHMLTSLGQKLSILGPANVVVEIPGNDEHIITLFTKLGYQKTHEFSSFTLAGIHSKAPDSIPLEVVTLDNLLELEAFDDSYQRSWTRQLQTLKNCKDELAGLGIMTDQNLESFLLYRADGDSRRILALGAKKDERFLRTLLQQFYARERVPVDIPMISEQEVSFGLLHEAGFEQVKTYFRYHKVVESA